ncbi:MAG: capsular polysaccharide biosynthesis protein [Ramlibacter sp.]
MDSYVSLLDFGIWRQPMLARVLGAELRTAAPGSRLPAGSTIIGWGRKRSGRRAVRIARAQGVGFRLLEDGFLRSFGPGRRFAPLSLVADDVGIYYDSTAPSALENLLNADRDLLAGIGADVDRARELILRHRLSKYNAAPDWDDVLAGRPLPGAAGAPRVLVVDQTAGDLSVALGGADASTFQAMLAAARAENPGATVFVKTHPEVSSGHKAGYLTAVANDEHTVVLREAISPLSLVERMDRVYVVSSTMGFEALLAGKPVTCFGLPWYAGWGATDDRQACPRRTRRRSVRELFAAGYFHYPRYLDPVTRARGTIFHAIDWLVRQREMAARTPCRLIGVGFRRWKAANLQPMLALDGSRVTFVASTAEAQRLQPRRGDSLFHWGATPPAGLAELAEASGAAQVRMEDGYVRSVGLGSDLIRPHSLVLDTRGIYFDPSRPSDLEHLLKTAVFTPDELHRAREARAFIVANGVTKYNLEPRARAAWPSQGRRVLLVPGQVEDDASIRLGCTDVRTNLGLLQAARRACPDAYIVYKPHPDVMSGNRVGQLGLAAVGRLADHIEANLSVVSCIDACDEVHTMTSLTGFDALLRGKVVVVYGQPFYAGWGLTRDVVVTGVALARRGRKLTLDELVAGALLRYPFYWDWELNGYATCESVLRRIVERRQALEAKGGLEGLRSGFFRRQWRKARVLALAWTGGR